MRTHRKLMLAAAAALALAGTSSQAQEVVLKIHHFLPSQATIQAQVFNPWCEKIGKESGGRLKCQIYPAMSLGGSPPQIYDQIKDGVTDIGWTLPGYNAGRFPISEAFELPFMTSGDTEGTSRALWDYVQLHARDEFKDVRPLAFHVHGPGLIHMRDKQIRTLEDFKGIKVRGPSRQATRLIASLGATPVGMPVPAVSEALAKGVIDGTLIPWEVVPSVKVQELTKFHTVTDPRQPAFYVQTFVFAMNPAKYDALPADLRKVIDANSGAALSARAGKAFGDADAPARKLAENRNNSFYTVPAAEVARWRKASEPIVEEWIRERNRANLPGLKMIESARSLIAKYSKKPT